MAKKPSVKVNIVHDPEFIRLIDQLLSTKAAAYRMLSASSAVAKHKEVEWIRQKLIARNERRAKRAAENAKKLRRIDDNHRDPLDGVSWT